MRPWSLSVITDLVPMNNDTCSWTMALLSIDNIHFTLDRA